MNDDLDVIYNKLYYCINKQLNIEENLANPLYSNNIHPYLDICNGLSYASKAGITIDTKLLYKLLKNLYITQNEDGSWNEVYKNYNQKSALLTSLSGLSLINCQKYLNDDDIFNQSLFKAINYIKSQERSPGCYKKSEEYHMDILNVSASISAFFAESGMKFKDLEYLQLAEEAAWHVCCHQFSDGSFPYSSPIRAYPYRYHLNIPSIFYQCIVLYYLLKTNDVINKPWLTKSIQQGTNWLVKCQLKNGRFDWSKSGFPFSIYLNSTYALSLYIYARSNKNNNMNYSIKVLMAQLNSDGCILKLEMAPIITLPIMIGRVIKISKKGDYPIKYKLFRAGHCFYNEIARRRISRNQEDIFSKYIYRFMKIKSSTVPVMINYPDFGYTCESFNYLANTLYHIGKVHI